MIKLLILTLIFSKSLFSFTLSTNIGARFPNDEVKVNVSDQSCDNIGFTNERILELAAIAIDRFWNTVPTTRLTLERGSIVATSSDFKTQSACETGTNCTPRSSLLHTNDIIIACNQENTENFTSDSVLALALPNNVSGLDILGGIVLLNDTSATSGLNGMSDDEIISTLAHEIGHALGIGHSKFSKNLMHFASSTSRFYLGEDDINALTSLYPAEQPISACGSVDTGSGGNGPWSQLLTMLLALMGTCIFAKQDVRKLSF